MRHQIKKGKEISMNSQNLQKKKVLLNSKFCQKGNKDRQKKGVNHG